MRKLYEIIKDISDIEIKVLTAVFDNQGQIKRMALFNYIKKYEEINNEKIDIYINKLIKSAKLRIDPDTTIRINVDGFNLLKDFFIEKYPNIEELKPEEVTIAILLNTQMPTLSKMATKVYKRKVEYTRDLADMNNCIKEISRILDRYQLTTKALEDPNNDLEVSQEELMDTAKTRQYIERWKEQLPKSMKLAFKLQLRKFGDDNILKSIYEEIYQYEKWNIKIIKNN